MNNLVSKKGSLLNKFWGLYLLAAIMLWIKTYITQITQFKLGAEGALQQFLLFLYPLGSAMLFLGIAFLSRGRGKYATLVVIHILMSFLLYANVVYYRFFSDFITLPTIFQTQNF